MRKCLVLLSVAIFLVATFSFASGSRIYTWGKAENIGLDTQTKTLKSFDGFDFKYSDNGFFDVWKDGEVKGIKARGGFEIDIKWDKGQLVSAGIKSLTGKQCRLLYNENRMVKETTEGEEFIVYPEMFTGN